MSTNQGKIVHIGEATDNASAFAFSPVQLLKDVIAEIERGTIPANRVLVLCLNDREIDAYDVYIRIAQMRHSECLALMQYASATLLHDMFLE